MHKVRKASNSLELGQELSSQAGRPYLQIPKRSVLLGYIDK
jgi:hypothetical protein